MTLPGLLAILVVWVAMPLNWLVAFLLWRLVRNDPGGQAVRVAAVLSTCVALIVTVFGLVFINNGMSDPPLDSEQTQILTRGSLLVLSIIPAVYWLRWYRRENGHSA